MATSALELHALAERKGYRREADLRGNYFWMPEHIAGCSAPCATERELMQELMRLPDLSQLSTEK